MADSGIYNFIKPKCDIETLTVRWENEVTSLGPTLNSTIVFSMHYLHFDMPKARYFKDMNYLSYAKFDQGITVTSKCALDD
jgi:hypothetical protein